MSRTTPFAVVLWVKPRISQEIKRMLMVIEASTQSLFQSQLNVSIKMKTGSFATRLYFAFTFILSSSDGG